ncbi:killer cell lectin-like receptor subfamily G member 1 isoform X2 [Pteronotus mesoamericanus]|uniref:killer cell lectin-like receptor subfamily G member 1 isoform X2 n=1 Tax=Pteronotus mesoamericanus TaxID=1884717 RepID=UPI0023EC997B|nr:killer cell lectin-like receptor subfamily G member 1 isoform X2 [Pteronotus parnellii mesoamericanus]
MEMIDNAVYSVLELSTVPQAQNDYRPQQKASPSRCSPSRWAVIALGLLSAVLASVLLYKWTLCQGNCPCCPDFWMGYGDHCYYFSVEKKDWNSSLEFCLAEDSQLLMFIDHQEMDTVKIFLDNDTFYWIGLRKNSVWRWENGSVLNSLRVVSNSLAQTCGVIGKGGLQAASCQAHLKWACKKARL